MTRNKSTSFWTEAALRVQRQSIHVTVAEHAAEPSRPSVEPEPVAEQGQRQPERRNTVRREPPPLARSRVPTDDHLKLRLAEELDYARRMLDQMGDSLSSDTKLLLRHGVSLQSVDIVGQMIGHIANVIRAGDPAAAVEEIGMAELKGRLKRSRID